MMKNTTLTFLLLALLSHWTLSAQSGLRPRGDVNCDWEVNIADVNAMVDAIIAGKPYHSLYTYAYDINGDKEINIADLNVLIGAVLGDELKPMPTYSGTLPSRDAAMPLGPIWTKSLSASSWT